eukprot:TRINITY_DN1384_c0_g1_i1.p1 TRINITY_DN1384_c0_g1~~TRINITY_DN1384_c0_g1_i1.p1  ORF type:complete len:422 (+),score=35.43 TRINITY_DN1384_c0_g1_i1:648-1913(+)
MVMNLLGENLSELRKSRGKFSLVTTLKIGIKLIPILEALHSMGYVHRDIKPSNFVIGLYPHSLRREFFLIDFGLARRYVTGTGEIRQARDFTGFRGTARYASINSHMCRDLSRRDDMWSIFYLLVEFAKGSLPWSKLRDKDKIGEVKIQWNTADLVKGLPPEFLQFMNHLQSLKYSDTPDYLQLKNLLKTALSANINTETEASAFRWENQAPPARFLTALNYVASMNSGQIKFADGGAGTGLTITDKLTSSSTSHRPKGKDRKPYTNFFSSNDITRSRPGLWDDYHKSKSRDSAAGPVSLGSSHTKTKTKTSTHTSHTNTHTHTHTHSRSIRTLSHSTLSTRSLSEVSATESIQDDDDGDNDNHHDDDEKCLEAIVDIDTDGSSKTDPTQSIKSDEGDVGSHKKRKKFPFCSCVGGECIVS